MLSENIKAFRKSKGLSQQELAVKLKVVRQTVSKWEQGLSVPDSDLLLALSAALETPVSALLGETAAAQEPDDLKVICKKLEVINLQLARRKARHPADASLAVPAGLRGNRGHAGPSADVGQPLPELGPQRPRDRRGRHAVPRL